MNVLYHTFIVGLVALACQACSGAHQNRGDICGRHEQCGEGEICSMGVCEPGDLNAPLDVSGINASEWFTYSDGSCVSDPQCGPWVCVDQYCQDPAVTDRVLPPLGNFSYWDASCLTQADCGTWVCVERWCTDPAYVGAQPVGEVERSTDNGVGDGRACLGDLDCAGAECMAPGYCHPGRGQEVMTFADIDILGWVAYSDGSCNYDEECGPYACQSGWCVPIEQTDRYVPLRQDFEYYDASCTDDADCPFDEGWICMGGWCHDRGYLGMYSPSPTGQGLAAEGVPYAPFEGYRGEEDPWGYSEDPYYGDGYIGTCSTNAECGPGAACVYPGECAPGLANTPMYTDGMDASVYFSNPDGKCAYDNECGPWMCSTVGICAPPGSVGRVMQNYAEYTYFDTSCMSDADCGGWVCATGWCTQPGYAGP